jgi:hypothetical protein
MLFTIAFKLIAYSEIFDNAFTTNLLQKDAEQIIPVVLARASYERRRLEALEAQFKPSESQIPSAGLFRTNKILSIS